MKNHRKNSKLIHGKSPAHNVWDSVSTQYVITVIIPLITVINKGS